MSGAVAGATVLGGGIAAWVRSNAAVATERLGIRLPEPVAPLPPPPEGVSVGLDGVSRFFTPNDEFYRIDTALVVPRVSAQDWEMRVHGLVEQELTLDYRTPPRPAHDRGGCNHRMRVQPGRGRPHRQRLLAGVSPGRPARGGAASTRRRIRIVGRSVDGFTAGFPPPRSTDGTRSSRSA
ncbi:MAG: hypothetical protein R2716_13280 [Microthrixaceae bacterium]